MRAGVDVVAVSRFGVALERTPALLQRVFTPDEVSDCTRGGVAGSSLVAVRRLAARFAAKEAARKALGLTRARWLDLEVRSRAGGAPELWVHGRPAPAALSLAHDGDVAIAFVVADAPDAPAATEA